MKNKNRINLYDNETLEHDIDDLMEEELKDFHKVIANIKEEDRLQFKNWLKIYKALNYDIFENLTVDKVYRFSKYSAVIELSFNGKKEYDLLAVNEDDKTVGVMNVKNGSVKKTVIRRLLIPETVDEALMYAISEMDEETVLAIGKTMKEIETNGAKYDVTKKFGKYLGMNIKEENKNVENKTKESKKNNKQKEDKKVKEVNEIKGRDNKKEDKKEKEIERQVEVEDELYVMDLLRKGYVDKAREILNNKIYSHVNNSELKELFVNQFIDEYKIITNKSNLIRIW